MRPEIGKIVRVTLAGQTYAAIIVQALDDQGRAAVTAFTRQGLWQADLPYSEEPSEGHWHWAVKPQKK